MKVMYKQGIFQIYLTNILMYAKISAYGKQRKF